MSSFWGTVSRPARCQVRMTILSSVHFYTCIQYIYNWFTFIAFLCMHFYACRNSYAINLSSSYAVQTPLVTSKLSVFFFHQPCFNLLPILICFDSFHSLLTFQPHYSSSLKLNSTEEWILWLLTNQSQQVQAIGREGISF